eukprot:s1329_g17.t1
MQQCCLHSSKACGAARGWREAAQADELDLPSSHLKGYMHICSDKVGGYRLSLIECLWWAASTERNWGRHPTLPIVRNTLGAEMTLRHAMEP